MSTWCIVVLAVLAFACNEPTLELEPRTNAELTALSSMTAVASRDGISAVSRLRALLDGDSTCPYVIPASAQQAQRIVGGCRTSSGATIDGSVNIEGDPRGSSTYRFNAFTISDNDVITFDGTVTIETGDVRVDLTTSRRGSMMRAEMSSTCARDECEADGTIDVDGLGFVTATGTTSSTAGSLEIHGADTDDDRKHRDNVLTVEFGPACLVWTLTTNDWFRADRKASSC